MFLDHQTKLYKYLLKKTDNTPNNEISNNGTSNNDTSKRIIVIEVTST